MKLIRKIMEWWEMRELQKEMQREIIRANNKGTKNGEQLRG